MNKLGTRSSSLMVFAKLLFASKNTLARLLVLVVSMGFGVVKPRLGPAGKQIAAVGLAYFFFAAVYGVTHAVGETEDEESKAEMVVVIPLSMLDAGIFWWVFLSLAHTMKILSLRNNAVKLQMYVYFKWTLAVCVGITVVFAIWSIYDRFGRPPKEEYDWENAWLQESFWQILFLVILSSIMFLWRPTVNNSRYAYAPLDTDLDDDEDYSIQPNFSVDVLSKRTLSARGRSSPKLKEKENESEADLKWVEDNIPASVVLHDNTFPSYPMDSDEEVVHTRFEMSKME